MARPQAGNQLSLDDIQMILDAIEARQNNFPGEPKEISLIAVMIGIGDRYTMVQCTNNEWVGQKKDIKKGSGIPTCPNGHPLFELNAGRIGIGWVRVD